jgi:hypothetical protein
MLECKDLLPHFEKEKESNFLIVFRYHSFYSLLLFSLFMLFSISKIAILTADIPVLNGYAPSPLSVFGFTHS